MAAILITGATDGLGRGLAAALAERGDTVLVHGRSQERIDATLAELPGEGHRGYRADLASLGEVRGLAAEVSEREERLDALVNNAGIGTDVPGGGERMESADGHELRFAVNYLAGYLLTRELLPLLERSAPARIVNVSSAGQMPIDLDDPMIEREDSIRAHSAEPSAYGYSGVRAYCQSKLAQILFTVDLAERLPDGVTVTALHPATYMPTKIVASPASSLEEGVEATMRLVTDPQLEGVSGSYFNGLREQEADSQAYDADARARLRELSERLTAA
jgi:NAD(P)-dependent dehydrogenase (short-subunit alcohol dehydrogenase family)